MSTIKLEQCHVRLTLPFIISPFGVPTAHAQQNFRVTEAKVRKTSQKMYGEIPKMYFKVSLSQTKTLVSLRNISQKFSKVAELVLVGLVLLINYTCIREIPDQRFPNLDVPLFFKVPLRKK